MVQGSVAAGFERVRYEFDRNFRDRDELGAACAIYHRGEKVVDIWGGSRDRDGRLPWQEDTVVMVFSTSKGLAAMTLALLHSRGLLDYDELVATYWPEFAQNGKEAVTVRQLVSHQAGLCAIDEPLTPELVGDLDRLAAVVAAQRPAWPPGVRQGYHAMSIGWYEQELVRRIDPEHRSLGHFFADEIAGPLELDFWIGLPDDVSHDRIARLREYRGLRLLGHLGELPREMALAFVRRNSLTARTFGNPRVRSAAGIDRPEWWRVEFPSAGGIGDARSIARAYSEFATGGAQIGLAQSTLDELSRPAAAPSGGTRDAVLKVPTAYACGFLKPSQDFEFATSMSAYGHPGAGGSFGFADPDAELGFAYVMNRMGMRLHDDPRERALRVAMYDCVAGQTADRGRQGAVGS